MDDIPAQRTQTQDAACSQEGTNLQNAALPLDDRVPMPRTGFALHYS